MEGNRFDPTFGNVKTFLEQRCGDVRAERGIVASEVVGVGVGNEGAWFRIPWIEPQVGFWQIQASLETNFDHGFGKLRDIAGSAKGIKRGKRRKFLGQSEAER